MTSGRSWRWLHQRQPVATLEAVANGNDYLAQRDVSLQESRGPQHEFSFVVGEAAGTGNNLVEIRVWTNGTVPLSLSSITVERRHLPFPWSPAFQEKAGASVCR
jgi:hypothetical protein